ncbi:helix-turn-helix domain-containing protein [Catellatospora paridis]|uniref:helix-turn-helix domain-containing protein n=1 Tax=Catellatospora paridis TaxID=1617086 RepID=UPI0012D4477E|nr:helix-turn-helix domain-containing protein [Catellatospora paridis]
MTSQARAAGLSRTAGNSLPSPSAELSNLTRAWRLRLNRRRAGLPARVGARQTVRQSEAAELVGYSAVWYARLERGQRDPGYSDAFLDRVSVVLRLNYHERIVLYRLAAGRNPAPRALQRLPTVDDSTARFVEQVPTPAWCMTAAGDIRAANTATGRWLPTLVEMQQPNFPLWVCTSPSARQQLLDWRDGWAVPALAQLRAALAERPNDAEVRAVLAAVLSARPDLQAAWDELPQVRVHPGHAIRQMIVAGIDQPVSVHHISLELTANPGVQLFAILPEGR